MVGIILNIVKCVLIIFYYFGITMSVERTNKGIKKYEDVRSDLILLILICLV